MTKSEALIQRTADTIAAIKVLGSHAVDYQADPIRAEAELAEAIYKLLPDVGELKEHAETMRADLELPEGMDTIGRRYVRGFE